MPYKKETVQYWLSAREQSLGTHSLRFVSSELTVMKAVNLGSFVLGPGIIVDFTNILLSKGERHHRALVLRLRIWPNEQP